MNSILKSSIILLALSAVALAQSAPKKSPSNSPKTQSAAAPAASTNSGASQHDAAANKNQGSGSHSGNMIGNHKDVMGTAAAPSAGAKNSPATQPAPASKPN
jgi:hypothetical protein